MSREAYLVILILALIALGFTLLFMFITVIIMFMPEETSSEDVTAYVLVLTTCCIPLVIIETSVAAYSYKKAYKEQSQQQAKYMYEYTYKRYEKSEQQLRRPVKKEHTSTVPLVRNPMCPACGKTIYDVFLKGDIVKCPYCGKIFIVEKR